MLLWPIESFVLLCSFNVILVSDFDPISALLFLLLFLLSLAVMFRHFFKYVLFYVSLFPVTRGAHCEKTLRDSLYKTMKPILFAVNLSFFPPFFGGGGGVGGGVGGMMKSSNSLMSSSKYRNI